MAEEPIDTGPLQVVDVYLENNDHLNQVTYKRKLRISLQNTADRRVVLGPGTKWSRSAEDIETQPRNGYSWQREGGRG